LKGRPGRTHHELMVPGGPGPKLLGDERHEGMKEAEDVVEAKIRDILSRRVACPQPLLDGFEVPVAELVPREVICRGHRILEFEVLDPSGHRSARIRQPRHDPSVLEVLVHL